MNKDKKLYNFSNQDIIPPPPWVIGQHWMKGLRFIDNLTIDFEEIQTLSPPIALAYE